MSENDCAFKTERDYFELAATSYISDILDRGRGSQKSMDNLQGSSNLCTSALQCRCRVPRINCCKYSKVVEKTYSLNEILFKSMLILMWFCCKS